MHCCSLQLTTYNEARCRFKCTCTCFDDRRVRLNARAENGGCKNNHWGKNCECGLCVRLSGAPAARTPAAVEGGRQADKRGGKAGQGKLEAWITRGKKTLIRGGICEARTRAGTLSPHSHRSEPTYTPLLSLSLLLSFTGTETEDKTARTTPSHVLLLHLLPCSVCRGGVSHPQAHTASAASPSPPHAPPTPRLLRSRQISHERRPDQL